MNMFNKTTKQQGEWVMIEGLEFLEVDGNYISKDNVGSDWVEFNDETTKRLMELADSVGRDDDVNFLLLEHVGDGAEVVGHRVSDKMVLDFIVAMIDNFVDGSPIKTALLLMAIEDSIMGDDE